MHPMICYFSATGNCKRVAERIAEATGDRAVSIEGLDPSELNDETLSLVSPVYFWTAPIIVQEFLSKVKPKDLGFLIVTYGTTTGHFKHDAESILGRKFSACFDLRMPDTWTPQFDLSDSTFVEG